MSAKKRKIQAIQHIIQPIQDILIDIKPKLTEAKRSAWPSLIPDLNKLAALAESITQQCPRSNKDWMVWLRRSIEANAGVNLWNASGPIKDGTDGVSREVVAASLIHVLQLASKAGASLSDVGRHDVAASILACAAKYEEQLRTADDDQNQHQLARVQAVTLYLSCRMEAAWREGNEGVAEFMLQKIIENDQRLRLLPTRDCESLASKLLEIGKDTLKGAQGTSDKTKFQDAIKWTQKAFAVVEYCENTGETSLGDLKRSILRSLARAYYLSSSHDPDNLDKAEASLNELIDTIDSAADRGSPEHQQLRWMRVAVLKKRHAAESQLLEAFKSIIDHMSFCDSTVTETLTKYHVLVTSIHQYTLQNALDAESGPGLPYVDRILLSLLFHCSKDDNHGRAMQDVEAAFASLENAEYELPKIPTTACLTLLWQFGDRHYSAKRWGQAADWFICGTHKVLASMARASHAKCLRKAALSHIQGGEYATASTVLRRCPGDEAVTHYLMMLAAVHQGLEDEAIRAVKTMVKAPDFDRKMLLLATQLANETDMKKLLLSVLEALLETLDIQQDEIHTEAITLIRCIIRLVVKLIDEAPANRPVLVPILIGHFSTAKSLIERFHTAKRSTIVAKDISWLWRTAYNCAVQGCAEWENAEAAVSDLFDIAQNLLEVYCTSALTDVDAELLVYLTNATFAAVSGRVFALRRRLSVTAETPEPGYLTSIVTNVASCKVRIQRVLKENRLSAAADIERVQSFVHALRVFEVEVLCLMHEWTRVSTVIEDAVHSDPPPTSTLEAIADILWIEKGCPTEVLFTALEGILHACLDRMALSVEKFSRWLRALCTVLLARNTSSDRAKAIGYIEQAVAVLEDHSMDDQDNLNVYPMDERQWLLGTSYNTGIECLHASALEEAKRWFETSTVICRFVPEGTSRAAKISETYTHLLNRYSSRGLDTT
ncbi:hypothetical protein NM688_g744 [Phlebia brevispora]|uniref:Uncharacterized protein n=1 Tax=Phlebia brevispora TaxID=194682 RepID=A0ACC1TD46_9APHY|nr:hypothetical protein NM688_g744 [Phlebia brevispora]